ncbi:MAG: LytTR family transcriptional regulator [Clostridia bacterium]|nr:LytTR family transcriptional regulator [Clostridia bacterium]
MKFSIFIDKERDEEVIIYAHERTKTVDDIEALVSGAKKSLIGFCEDGAVTLEPDAVICFAVENNKVFAITQDGKYKIKQRLYQLEETLPNSFIKINQSCIANIKMIKKFDTSLLGTLNVIFINGYSDYVSRRNIKNVKERLGL